MPRRGCRSAPGPARRRGCRSRTVGHVRPLSASGRCQPALSISERDVAGPADRHHRRAERELQHQVPADDPGGAVRRARRTRRCTRIRPPAPWRRTPRSRAPRGRRRRRRRRRRGRWRARRCSLATLPVRTKMPVPMMTPTPKTVRSSAEQGFLERVLRLLGVADGLFDRLRPEEGADGVSHAGLSGPARVTHRRACHRHADVHSMRRIHPRTRPDRPQARAARTCAYHADADGRSHHRAEWATGPIGARRGSVPDGLAESASAVLVAGRRAWRPGR